jgi:hypothetical protein
MYHALHYDYPTPPIVARFATTADLAAYLAARPDCRRPIHAPVSPRGFHNGSSNGIVYEFRLATVDDLALGCSPDDLLSP